MRKNYTPEDVKSLGTILGVWAHPDDESFTIAGLMAAATRQGQAVACITATKGEKGSQDKKKWPEHSLGQVREKELKNALALIGVNHHHWLDYSDGGCHEISDDTAAARIGQLIKEHDPDTIITFPPDGLTGHYDHVAVSRWTRLAMKERSTNATLYYAVETAEHYKAFTRLLDDKFDVFFNIDAPTLIPEKDCDIVLELTPELAAIKSQALSMMPSQTEAVIREFGIELLQKNLGKEAFVRADKPVHWGTPKKVIIA